MTTLEPEVAALLFAKGEHLLAPIDAVARFLAMDPNDFRPSLASGELTGYVLETSPDGKIIRVGLDIQQLKEWMARRNIGEGGRPLYYSDATLKIVKKARWKAVYPGGDIEIPAAFMQSLIREDWKLIQKDNHFDYGLCMLLWQALGRKDQVPKRLPVYANMADAIRLAAETKKKKR